LHNQSLENKKFDTMYNKLDIKLTSKMENTKKEQLEMKLMCFANQINHIAGSVQETYKQDDDLSPVILLLYKVMNDYLIIKDEIRKELIFSSN
jgi:hypothetical protein